MKTIFILIATLFIAVVCETYKKEECIKLMEYLLSVQETSFLEYCKLAAEYCKHTLMPDWCGWFFITYENQIFNAVINKENPDVICKLL